jgi:hypothetical protein
LVKTGFSNTAKTASIIAIIEAVFCWEKSGKNAEGRSTADLRWQTFVGRPSLEEGIPAVGLSY